MPTCEVVHKEDDTMKSNPITLYKKSFIYTSLIRVPTGLIFKLQSERIVKTRKGFGQVGMKK